MARQTLGSSARGLLVSCAVVLLAGLVVGIGQADAKKPADAYKKRIAMSPIPFPARFANDDAFTKYIKKTDTREFFEDKEGGGWFIHYMAFFAEPLSSSRYLVLFYDITDPKAPILLTQTTSFPSKKGMRIMAGEYELEAGLFKADKKYLMLYTANINDGALAEAEFVLRAYAPGQAAELKAKREAEARKAKEDAQKAQNKRRDRKSTGPKFDFDNPDF